MAGRAEEVQKQLAIGKGAEPGEIGLPHHVPAGTVQAIQLGEERRGDGRGEGGGRGGEEREVRREVR